MKRGWRMSLSFFCLFSVYIFVILSSIFFKVADWEPFADADLNISWHGGIYDKGHIK